jgi:trehalose-phosphatase
MKDLFKNWKTVSAKIKKSAFILLLLDFDGTLCPIVNHPDLVEVDKDMLSLLNKLNKTESIVLGFVSGRPISDVKNQLKLKEVYYVGNHGLELKKPKSRKIEILAEDRIRKSLFLMRDVAKKLKKAIEPYEGVWLEDKKYSLTLHYRMANKKNALIAKKIFTEVVSALESKQLVRVTRGKKVFEVRPPYKQNKGTAVLKLKKLYLKKSPLLIYAGDDVTDEDVFRNLSSDDLGIHVGGNKNSKATYSLRNVRAVADFLKRVYLLKTGKIDA